MKKYRVINELNDKVAYVNASDNGEIPSDEYERAIKEVRLNRHHPNVLRIEQDIDHEFKLLPIIGKSKKKRVILKYRIAPVSKTKRDIDYQTTQDNKEEIPSNKEKPNNPTMETQAVNPMPIKRGPGRPPKRVKIYGT